jgi:hypothetical protein
MFWTKIKQLFKKKESPPEYIVPFVSKTSVVILTKDNPKQIISGTNKKGVYQVFVKGVTNDSSYIFNNIKTIAFTFGENENISVVISWDIDDS